MDKKKIQKLKRLNFRKIYCEELNNIIQRITVSDFLSTDETRKKLNCILKKNRGQ